MSEPRQEPELTSGSIPPSPVSGADKAETKGVRLLPAGEKVWRLLAGLLIAVIGWFYSQAIDTEILGFTHDDGVYAITSKALAQGKGFTLLHVIGEPAQIKYPILYPLLLAPVWLVNPNFPDNLPLLNYVTLAFGLASFAVMYIYLRQAQGFPGWLTLLTMVLVASNFFFIYFFTTVMSEAPYMLLTLLTLWVFHRYAERHGARLPVKALLVLAVLSALTFHTRVLGVTLMAAIGTWLVLHRAWQGALIYGAGALLMGVLPWVVWTRTHTPKMTELNYPLVNTYSNYGLEFVQNFKAVNYLKGLLGDISTLMSKLLEDMIPVLPNFFKVYPELDEIAWLGVAITLITLASVYLLSGYYLLQAISTVRRGWRDGRLDPGPFSVAGLYLFFYILAISLWRYEDQMARFITVLTPLLWLYFFKPVLPFLAGMSFRPGWRSLKAALALALILVVSVVALLPTANSYNIVRKSRSENWVESGKNKWLWNEYKTVFSWINENLPQDAKLAVASDVVFYLYTGRSTFYVFYASLRRAHGRYLPESFPKLMKSLDHYDVEYLVVEPHMQFRTMLYPQNAVARQLLEQFPHRFRKIYESPSHGTITIYRILPEKAAAGG